MTIIDVSEWQGVINWNKAKPHIDGAILRCGCGAGYDDRQWARNVHECERLGIPSSCSECLYKLYDGTTGSVYDTTTNAMNTEFVALCVQSALQTLL